MTRKIAYMGGLTGHALQRSANSVCSAYFSAACEPYNIHKSSPRQTSTAQTARISQLVAGFDYLSSAQSRGLRSLSRCRNMLSGNRTPRTIYSGLVTWNRLLNCKWLVRSSNKVTVTLPGNTRKIYVIPTQNKVPAKTPDRYGWLRVSSDQVKDRLDQNPGTGTSDKRTIPFSEAPCIPEGLDSPPFVLPTAAQMSLQAL